HIMLNKINIKVTFVPLFFAISCSISLWRFLMFHLGIFSSVVLYMEYLLHRFMVMRSFRFAFRDGYK
ncbi:hypothetical protein ACLSZ7_09965, partial [Avibacterium gallinarum]|uniref:hypothetical protein n=1 Tax=Avibacterium gallinarum TaxID=755 RepID=UPI003BF8F368